VDVTEPPPTLAEAKAERHDLAGAIARHKHECPACGSTARGRARPAPCDQGRWLANRRRYLATAIQSWFAPGPGQGALI
jgi:hypothetical protein